MSDKKKILIFGANSFSGKYLLNYFSEFKLYNEFYINCCDIHKKLNLDYEDANLNYITITSIEYAGILEIIESVKPNFIINFTGIFHSDNFNELYSINVQFVHNILNASLKYESVIEKILLIGSAAEYGTPKYLPINEDHPLNPINYYGLSKVFQYTLFKYFSINTGLRINLARTFNIIGEGQSEKLAFGSFLKQINEAENNGKIYVGNLNTKRDIMDITDVIKSYWAILIKGVPGEVYNVCSGESASIHDILMDMIKKSGKNIEVLVNNDRIRSHDVSDIYGDNSKLVSLL